MHLVVRHISGGGTEFGVGLDDFVDGLEKVFLGCNLPAGSDGKHACLRAHAADLRTCQQTRQQVSFSTERCVDTHGANEVLWFTSAIGTQAGQQLEANVPLHTHGASVDLKDVRATLKREDKRPNVRRAKRLHESDLRVFILQVFTSRSGRLNSIFLSRRPGLMRAGSKVSGRLVAIRTLMFPRGSNPSS